MKKNFSFNFNTNFSVNGKKLFTSSTNEKQDLSPQQEYWLNRILREYGRKVFLVIMLFMILMFVVVFVTSNGDQNTQNKLKNMQIEFGK